MAKFQHPDKWQRDFLVTDHLKRKKDHVLFKITSIVFPKGQPDAATKISVWKRYDDFKILCKQLKPIYSSLNIAECFPVLYKHKLFQKYSDNTIKKQKESILLLLEFVSRYPLLFISDPFVKFFQSGYCITDTTENTKPEIYCDDFEEWISQLIMGQVVTSESSPSSDESISNDGNSVARKSYLKISRFKKNANSDMDSRMPLYYEEAAAHAAEAHQQEMLGNYEASFAMYKSALVCLFTGIRGDSNEEHRRKVKEKTTQYIMRAEWVYNNHLKCPNSSESVDTMSSQVPWRSRSQMKRYKVIDIVHNNLLVQDTMEQKLVFIKGVLKSNLPLDRSERCIIPKDVPFMVHLYGIHETDTTVFFVLEHIRYGRLWDHLEHYFLPGFICDDAESEITSAVTSPVNFDDAASDTSAESNESTVSITGGSNNLSRLESSIHTDLSCESLSSSHDENYFDLIEDYARVKNEKLKQIQDFNERQKHVEALKSVKKTASQVDLKSMDDCRYYRSQSLSDLGHDCSDEIDSNVGQIEYVNDSIDIDDNNEELDDDIDTQRLLQNAQKLIESINETLSRSECVNIIDGDNCKDYVVESSNIDNYSEPILRSIDTVEQNKNFNEQSSSATNKFANSIRKYENSENRFKFTEGVNITDSPRSESVPSITEEYSTTAMFQRNSLTMEMIKKWAAQLLMAIDSLHDNGIICRDLNPDNILLSDDGSIRLTYFYRYPNIDTSVDPIAAEKLYVAPEVKGIFGISFAADYWSYGAILYELITLKSLYQNHPGGIHSYTVINIPEKIPAAAYSLLDELLKYDPNERLGCSNNVQIKSHPFFAGINWETI